MRIESVLDYLHALLDVTQTVVDMSKYKEDYYVTPSQVATSFSRREKSPYYGRINRKDVRILLQPMVDEKYLEMIPLFDKNKNPWRTEYCLNEKKLPELEGLLNDVVEFGTTFKDTMPEKYQ